MAERLTPFATVVDVRGLCGQVLEPHAHRDMTQM